MERPAHSAVGYIRSRPDTCPFQDIRSVLKSWTPPPRSGLLRSCTWDQDHKLAWARLTGAHLAGERAMTSYPGLRRRPAPAEAAQATLASIRPDLSANERRRAGRSRARNGLGISRGYCSRRA